MLGVPMIVREEVIGILFLDNEDRMHPFDSEQQSLAASFAHLAGIAIMQGQRSSELRTNLSDRRTTERGPATEQRDRGEV